LIRSKKYVPELENFEIKYDFERFDERNNFPYRNFLRFRMYFVLKIREASRIWISRICWNFSLGPQILMKCG
jgi:hypothetical protein